MNDIKRSDMQPLSIAWLPLLNEFVWMGLSVVVLLGLFVLGDVPQVAKLVAPLRFGLGLFVTLYLPGYCLTAALFPRRTDLDDIERVGLSLGLSIAWVSILALFLNVLPAGLSFWPIVWGEVAGISLFMTTAVYRRLQLPVHTLYAPVAILPRQWWQQKNNLEKRLLWACLAALLLISSSVGMVFTAVTSQQNATEFYMLGEAGLAENFPRQATLDEPVTLTLGIHNEGAKAQTYRIEIVQNNVWTNETTLLKTIDALSLEPDQRWQEAVSWQMASMGDDQQVAIYLYIDNKQEPYRELRLWLDVVE